MRAVNHLAVVVCLVCAGSAASSVLAQCDPAFQTGIGNTGANSTVWTVLAVDEVSAVGPAAYMAGQFNTAGGTSAVNIAKWNGAAWSNLGTGATGTVYCLAAKNGLLYAGGGFSGMGGQANTRGIAQWNGTAWSAVGTGMAQNNSGPRALTFWGDDLWCGGFFNEMGGATAHKLAKWNGTSWSTLPGDPIGTTSEVAALAVWDSGGGEALYIGGDFNSGAGGNANNRNICKWDGATLTPLGRGADAIVEAIAVWNGSLYIGGGFTNVIQSDGTLLVANRIARWNGTAWSAVGSGINAIGGIHVWSLCPFDTGAGEILYAGGNFSSVSGNSAIRNIAAWNGTAWAQVSSSSMNGGVYGLSLSRYDGGLYMGGLFTTAGTPSANRIVRYAGNKPVSPINADAAPPAITIGDSSTLSASVAGSTIHWYTGSCGGTQIGTGNALPVSPTQTTTYYARANNGTCFSYSCDDVTVTVNCTPDAPTNAFAAPKTITIGGSSTLSASVPGSIIYWYVDGCGSNGIGSGDSLVVSPAETTTYYARSYNGTCYSATCDAVTVNVNCTPDTPTNAFATPDAIFIGESSTLSASVPGSEIFWYTGSCGLTNVGTGGELEVTPADTTTYYARAYNGFCFSASCDAVTVNVECRPDAPTNAFANPDTVFIGNSSTLSASVPGSIIYWYTGTCGFTEAGTGDELVVTPFESETYYARAYNGYCFSLECDPVHVTVECAPDTPTNAFADPDTIVVGESSTLSASAPGSSINWYEGGCGANPVGSGDTLLVSPTVTTTYYARSFNGICESDDCDSAMVTVTCPPVDFSQQPVGGSICPGHPRQMCVAATGHGTLHYQWRRNNLALIGQTNPCYTATQAGSYTCLVTDNCGPTLSDTALVGTANPAAGDLDGDGDADLDDYAALAPCLNGPDGGIASGCACYDVVIDGDIDLVDFAALQRLLGN